MSPPDTTRRPGGVAASAVDRLDLAGRLSGDPGSLDDFARALGGRPGAGPPYGGSAGVLPSRINAERGTADRDLAKLVLTVVELLRRLMERQAVRRVNAGSLGEDEVERMGETFLELDRKMAELTSAFGLRREDLNLNLGPLGDLM